MAIPTFSARAPAESLVGALVDQGAIVIEGVIDEPTVSMVRAGCRELLDTADFGDNDFDGYRTRRVFDPLRRTRLLDSLVLHPVVHAVVRGALGWPYQFGMTILSQVCPDERAQRPHRDAAVYPLPRDFPDVMVNTIWALDDFTPENGATLIAPGSHRDRTQNELIPAAMDGGSVMIYSGGLLHGAGANLTETSRLGLIVEHVARWLRPAECHPLAVGVDIISTLPPELQELLGFNQTSEYFGFINGKPPADWLNPSELRREQEPM